MPPARPHSEATGRLKKGLVKYQPARLSRTRRHQPSGQRCSHCDHRVAKPWSIPSFRATPKQQRQVEVASRWLQTAVMSWFLPTTTRRQETYLRNDMTRLARRWAGRLRLIRRLRTPKTGHRLRWHRMVDLWWFGRVTLRMATGTAFLRGCLMRRAMLRVPSFKSTLLAQVRKMQLQWRWPPTDLSL